MSETEALLAEFDRDPETGLSKIMDRFEKPLVPHARAVRLHNEAAKDVVQETFIRFLTESGAQDSGGQTPTGGSGGAFMNCLREDLKVHITDVLVGEAEMPVREIVLAHLETCASCRPTGSSRYKFLDLRNNVPDRATRRAWLHFGACA